MLDEWNSDEYATSARKETTRDIDLGEGQIVLFERLIKTRFAVLICQGNCHMQVHGQFLPRYTRHSYRRALGKISEMTNELHSVAVIFSCDVCGHERKWGIMSGDPHKPDPA